MKIDKSNIKKNLPKKGFIKNKDNHHIYFHHQYNGVDTGIYTYVSHGKPDDYSGTLFNKVKKQLKLNTNQELANLVNCPMDGDDYIELLKINGHIEESEK